MSAPQHNQPGSAVAVKGSAAVPSLGPPPTPRELLVLTELNATVSTLSQIEGLLDDIIELVSDKSTDSIFSKQERVIRSLNRWERVVRQGKPRSSRKKSPKKKDNDTP